MSKATKESASPEDDVTARPLKSNPHWKDIIPIMQDDGPEPVVPIAYRPDFKESMDYFRAILKKNELSLRALKLTHLVISGNAANYTAWHFRRLCLFALNADLEQELKWVEGLAREGPKNYQLWHHRRVLLERLDKPLNELKNTAEILVLDGKNYHVWSHRQWILKKFGLFADELKYVDFLLTADIRNNSAWNQRHFVIMHTGDFTKDTIANEIKYTSEQIRKVPNNESPWNYVEGLLKKPQFESAHSDSLVAFANEIIGRDEKCPYSYSLLFELYEKKALAAKSKPNSSASDAVAAAEAAAAIAAVTKLAEIVDPVRNKYWVWRRDNFALPKTLPALASGHASPQTATAAAAGSAPVISSGPTASTSPAPAATAKK